jgi:hypothetical protein
MYVRHRSSARSPRGGWARCGPRFAILLTPLLAALLRPAPATTGAALINADARALTRFLHRKIRMTDAEIATVANVTNEQTIRRWRSTASKSTPRDNEYLDDLRAIVSLQLQSGVMYPEEIGRWLRSRVADLSHARPYVLLGQGKFEEVKHAAELHIQRLEGRVLDPEPPEDEMEQLFAAPSAEEAPDEDLTVAGPSGKSRNR